MKATPKSLLFFFLKYLFPGLLIGVVVNKLFLQEDIRLQWQLLTQQLQKQNPFLLIVVVTLMPLNWLVESLKWKRLSGSSLSTLEHLKSVLYGVSLGFVTPGRSGEFVGRAFYFTGISKSKLIFLSAWGGVASLLASLLVAFVSSLFFANEWVAILLAVSALVTWIAFFRFEIVLNVFSRFSFVKKGSVKLPEAQAITAKEGISILLISLLRYSIYLSQFSLLLIYFGINLSAVKIAGLNSIFFALQTFSPVVPYLDWGIRGGLALYVYQSELVNPLSIVAATTLLWVINLMIPALAGYFFIAEKKSSAYVIK